MRCIIHAVMTGDKEFMSIALECAALGRGCVEPNPMVGAVLVAGGREIARGWHARFGGPHAEVEALTAARRAGCDVSGATMYVTLEPCRHQGKTPPCTEAIIAAGIARVVAAMEDPDPLVSGGGIRTLREAGIEVDVGLCQDAARELLAGYCKLRTARRPWVICKWAQTPRGLLALPPGGGRWISGPEAREYVHHMRGRCQGVLVGIGTVLADDPDLTNRGGSPGRPARVVLDSRLRLPPASRLARSAGDSPMIVATTAEALSHNARAAEALSAAGVELLELPPAPGGVDAAALLDELGRREWTYLLVEGGAGVLASFVLGRLADELIVFVSPETKIEPETDSLPAFDIARLDGTFTGTLVEEKAIGQDIMRRYRVDK